MALAGLVLLPVMFPVWGLRFVIDRLREEAEANLRDEGRGFAELIDLSMRHSAGKISDAEFAEQEAALLDRLSAIREYRDELFNGAPDPDEDESYDVEADEFQDGSLDNEPYVSEDVLLDAGPDVNEVQS